MIHYCHRCEGKLALILAHNLWSVHKACPKCGIIYTCWGARTFPCETPALHVPLPLVFADRVTIEFRRPIPGPNHRGLL